MSVENDELFSSCNKTHSDDVIRLSKRNRKILNSIAVLTNNTSDEVLYKEYENTTADYARGYLSGLANSGSSQKVLLAYFMLKMLIKNN